MDDQKSSLDEVLREELEEVMASRENRGVPDSPESEQTGDARLDANLFGLAISGGGIRSATFNLGIIQALARLRLLHWIDYVSTVSGGGYIGSWLHGWSTRHEDGILGVEESLARAPTKPTPGLEPHPVRFLRQFSNYLTPRLSIWGADYWTVVATYVRNLLLTQTVLILALGSILLIPHALTSFVPLLTMRPENYLAIGVVLLIFGFIRVGLWRGNDATAFHSRERIQLIVASMFLSSLFFTASIEPLDHDGYGIGAAGLGGLSFIVWSVAALSKWLALKLRSPDRSPSTESNTIMRPRVIAAATIAGTAGGALLKPLAQMLPAWDATTTAPLPQSLLVFGPPAFVLVFCFVFVLQVALAGPALSRSSLEWWSRLGAWLLIYSVLWVIVFGVALWGPTMMRWLLEDLVSAVTAAGVWLVPTISGLLVAQNGGRSSEPDRSKIKRLLVKATPFLFVFGLFLAVSLGVETGLKTLEGSGPAVLISVALGAVPILWVAWTLDINRFSMHLFYRNRLIRCYLGASNSKREADSFTGFDANDDLPLAEVATKKGPFPIFNTALNLVSGHELAWQQRKAASFSFTPKSSGFEFPRFRKPDEGDSKEALAGVVGGFRPTRDVGAREDGINMGSCVAISGAAASPNMGANSNPSMAFLMTIFNVRLGWWVGNPTHESAWRQSGPHSGMWHLLCELIGLTNERSPFVYLSDGGHFENLAIYELVRRRCRFIIAVDAGQDHGFHFDDLGNVIRKCRADFGVNIDIDVDSIRPGESGRSERCCAVGTIHYPSTSGRSETGKLLYIKPSLAGTEPSDVLNYALRNPGFPHQSTADQWFDEAQFESYRQLGFHIGMTAIEGALNETLEQQRAS